MATKRGRRVNRGRGEGSIFQRGDGRWAAALTDPTTGKRRYRYGPTYEAARDILHAMRTTVASGAPIPGRRETLGDFTEGWLERIAGRVRSRTIEGYRSIVAQHVAHRCGADCRPDCALRRDSIGDRVLATLQADDIDKFLMRKRASGLQPRTVARIRQLACAVLRSAAKLRRHPDVSHLVDPIPGAADAPRPKPLDLQETRTLLASVRGTRLEGFVWTAAFTGARLSELLGLVWSDVDLDAATITVSRSLHRRSGEGFYCAEPKTRQSARCIPISAELAAVLRAHRVRQSEARLRAGSAWAPFVDLVFPTSTGAPQHPRGVLRDFHAACDKAGVRRVRLHDLRHACASQLLAAGVDIPTVSATLGHASADVTMRVYAHSDDTRLRAAADRLGAALAQ